MNKKRILQIIAMVLILSMMLSTVAFAMPPGQVKQLERNQNRFEIAFKHMRENGIMYGYGNDDYGLEDYVNRGDITVMIVRAFKLSMMDEIEEIENKEFLDLIDKNCYYYGPVMTAKKLGIAKGDGKNFHPNNYVTYEEAILLIDRSVKVANSNVTVLNDEGEEIKLRDWYNEFVKKDESAFREYLYDLLKEEGIKDFSKPALREDIALMLYFVLTGDKDYIGEKYEKLPIIKDTIKENTSLNFGDLSFKSYIDRVKFVHPDKSEGTLKINDKKIPDIEYEIEDIEDITFFPAVDFSGKVEIIYTAYDKDDIPYKGIIEITVLEVYEFKDITIDNYQVGDVINFVRELKKADKSIFNDIDYVMFKLPKDGELFIKYDKDGDDRNDEEFVLVTETDKYDLHEIEGLKYEPDDNDEVTIFYTAYDKDKRPDKEYDGAIVINID